MKTKINKLLGVLVVVMLLGSLTVGLAVPAAAADGTWSALNIPVAGALGNYVLAPTTSLAALNLTGPWSVSNPFTNDVGPSLLTKNKDGSILYVNWDIDEGAQGSNLYKSTDGGRTWIRCSTNTTSELKDVQITGIVTSPQDANRVYVVTREYDATADALVDQIYRSTDAGATFMRITTPSNEPVGNLPVFSLAVGYNGSHWLYVATNNGGQGDVFYMNDVYGGDWESTNFALNKPGRVVTKVFVSPNFATEAAPMVGALNFVPGTGSYVTFSYNNAAWGTVAGDDILFSDQDLWLQKGPSGPAVTNTLVPSGVGFPADFNSQRSARDFFIGVTFLGDTGDVYRIIASTSIAQGLDLSVTSVAVAGNAGACKLLAAGTNLSGSGIAKKIWHSENNGDTWTASQKDPPEFSGNTNKFLVMANDYNTSGKAWVAVAADSTIDFDDSGISQTLDFGVTWTDFSLLNTVIGQIQNMTPSPAYATDTSLFMMATGGPSVSDSVWKWDGKYWTRVHIMPAGAAATAIIQCSPNFSADKTVFLALTATNKIFRATDTGFWFKQQVSLVPGTFNGAMLVLSSTKLLVGTGANATITANNGTTWDEIGLSGAVGPITGLAVSPDGKSLLAGTNDGKVFLSADTGATWKQVPAGQAVTTTAGVLSVAFDTSYATNNTIFATSAGTNSLYSVNVAIGTTWNKVGAAKTGAVNNSRLVPGIQMAKDGTIYVFDKAAAGTGVVGTSDSFVIIGAAVSSGSILVTGGKVTVTPGDGATVNGGTTAVTSGTAPATVSFVLGDTNDYVVVSCYAGPANGMWTATGAVAGINSDADVDSTVGTTSPGAFQLVDAAGSVGTGDVHVVLRSIASGRGLYDPFPDNFVFPFGTGNVNNIRGVWYNDTTNGPQIWTLESSAVVNRIWTYTDRLTGKTTLNTPANNSSVGRQGSTTLVWTAMPTATNYQIQVGTSNTFFSGIIVDVSAGGTSYIVNGLQDGIQYFWRVRSAPNNLTPPGKAASQWSDVWAFTMGLGAAQWDPFVPAERVNPIPASYNVPLRPTFIWNPADWATGYEFVLSKAADFSSPIYTFTGATALKITAFVADKDLEFGTDYYWKVTAISATSKSNTAYGSFRTMLQPTVQPTPTLTVPAPVNITIPPQQNITPTWIWAIVIIGAVLVIAVIILIVTTRRVP